MHLPPGGALPSRRRPRARPLLHRNQRRHLPPQLVRRGVGRRLRAPGDDYRVPRQQRLPRERLAQPARAAGDDQSERRGGRAPEADGCVAVEGREDAAEAGAGQGGGPEGGLKACVCVCVWGVQSEVSGGGGLEGKEPWRAGGLHIKGTTGSASRAARTRDAGRGGEGPRREQHHAQVLGEQVGCAGVNDRAAAGRGGAALVGGGL